MDRRSRTDRSTDQPWWRTAVVYQVWPRSFADSDGDGVGDLRGVIGRLDHLADLGVDAVWLSPVYPSPGIDAGYDISDHTAVDPLFGSLADLDDLVAGLHSRGMRLVLDLVLNHTSDAHPWFVDSRSSRDSVHRDFYYWRDAPGDWRSVFSGPAWQHDPATDQYYLHTFAPEQPDLNWEHEPVREEVAALMRFWLDRGVDGFRLDVISMVSKDLERGTPLGFGPRLHEYLREVHTRVLAGRDLLTVGEMPGADVEQGRLTTDPAREELSMVFTFEHVGLDQGASKWDHVPLALPALKQNLAGWQEGLAPVDGVERGWNSLYWCNHDQPRVVSRFGDDGEHRAASAKTLATVLHLHRGTPFVYQGEELGMTNAGFTELAQYRDVESLNHHAEAVAAGRSEQQVLADLARTSRDNARTPMLWDDAPHHGFTTGTPWISQPSTTVPPAAAQRDDPASVLVHYRRLIALRHAEPAVSLGTFSLLAPDHQTLWAFTRRHGRTELLVLANLSSESLQVDGVDPVWAGAEVLLGNLPGEPVPGLTLRPWESRVLRRRVEHA